MKKKIKKPKPLNLEVVDLIDALRYTEQITGREGLYDRVWRFLCDSDMIGQDRLVQFWDSRELEFEDEDETLGDLLALEAHFNTRRIRFLASW